MPQVTLKFFQTDVDILHLNYTKRWGWIGYFWALSIALNVCAFICGEFRAYFCEEYSDADWYLMRSFLPHFFSLLKICFPPNSKLNLPGKIQTVQVHHTSSSILNLTAKANITIVASWSWNLWKLG